jgi:hypothetical protein
MYGMCDANTDSSGELLEETGKIIKGKKGMAHVIGFIVVPERFSLSMPCATKADTVGRQTMYVLQWDVLI